MIIHSSGEDYLESILILSKSQEHVRAIDICNYHGYSRPTVSAVVKQFKQNGLISVDSHNNITLTAEGYKIAERMYERHELIAKALIGLGVDRETAYEDACKIEHAISDKSFDALKKHLQ